MEAYCPTEEELEEEEALAQAQEALSAYRATYRAIRACGGTEEELASLYACMLAWEQRVEELSA